MFFIFFKLYSCPLQLSEPGKPFNLCNSCLDPEVTGCFFFYFFFINHFSVCPAGVLIRVRLLVLFGYFLMTAKPFFPHIFVFDRVCHGALSTCKHFCLDICWQVWEGVRGVIIDSWEAGTGVICSSFFLPGRLAFRIIVALQNRLIFFCQHSNYIRPISVVTAQSSHLHISAVSTAAIVAGCHADCDSITHFFFLFLSLSIEPRCG